METAVEFAIGVVLFGMGYRAIVGKWPWQRVEIRIPHRLAAAYEVYAGWINVPIYERGRFEIRRIDVVLALGGFGCVGWYWHTMGPLGAVAGGLAYAMVLIMALWIF